MCGMPRLYLATEIETAMRTRSPFLHQRARLSALAEAKHAPAWSSSAGFFVFALWAALLPELSVHAHEAAQAPASTGQVAAPVPSPSEDAATAVLSSGARQPATPPVSTAEPEPEVAPEPASREPSAASSPPQTVPSLRRVAPTVSAAAPQNDPRLAQLESTQASVAKLESSNRRLLAPSLALGFGIASLAVGGAVFAAAWNGPGYYNETQDRTGLTMMPLGAAIVLASMPVFILRLSRALRLRRAHVVLEHLAHGEQQGWASSSTPFAVDHAGSSGPALGVGLGSDGPWVGAHALYYFQLPSPGLRVAIRGGAGLMPSLSGDSARASWGASLGAFVAYGRRHRLVVGLSGGVRDRESWVLHGTWLGTRPMPSVWLDLGWEYMSSSGFFIRSTVGPALVIRTEVPLRERETMVGMAANPLSMGYKLW